MGYFAQLRARELGEGASKQLDDLLIEASQGLGIYSG